jgi:hypothetical protein
MSFHVPLIHNNKPSQLSTIWGPVNPQIRPSFENPYRVGSGLWHPHSSYAGDEQFDPYIHSRGFHARTHPYHHPRLKLVALWTPLIHIISTYIEIYWRILKYVDICIYIYYYINYN